MKIQIFILGATQTNSYLVWQNNSGIVIDPGEHPDLILEFITKNNINLEYVINTHGHFDHIIGNNFLISKTGAKLVVNREDTSMLLDPFYNLSAYMDKPFYSFKPDVEVKDGDKIDSSYKEFSFIHTPGHTPGSTCIYLPDDNIVFVGDTIFKFSYGRTDLPGGNERDLRNSIKRLLSILKDDDLCLPGHGESFRFGEVRKWLENLLGEY
ncbi:MAG: MBL fold metallo-hydrolase [Spirochaetia bacterium]|nr:MBL fold metallo-hydrolase [Spirochaetota bacterium]MDW8112594.1 MBL fold metallo-hydrolase [Spirochaetia bacterium]